MTGRKHRHFPSATVAPPAADRFVNPFNDRRLLAYYEQIYYWHGYIRFLGLPHLKDRPDVPIERLYVVPDLSEQRLAPEDRDEKGDVRRPLLETLAEHPRLVLLGDPGSGKSTLVSWIAYQLTRSGSAFVRQLGPWVPLPLVLRDLPLGADLGWDDLLTAFLERPVARDLDREMVDGLLNRGQGFVLLDGLDELGGRRLREAVRQAVLEGVARHPDCRWLATSRIVGYEEVPLHRRRSGNADLIPWDRFVDEYLQDEEIPLDFGAPGVAARQPPLRSSVSGEETDSSQAWARLLYVAPFSDAQIERFAHAWHVRYQESPEQARDKARDLVRSIHGSPSTHSLARVPNLLTLMALIHRIQATLPHGRAILYSKIAEAYLESIDTFYGLSTQGYSLEEKKRWLAKVGFEMQKRRTDDEEEKELRLPWPGPKTYGERPVTREILVEEAVLVDWLGKAMEDSPAAGPQEGTAEERAEHFVSYIARRSGLLLPRGEGLFAFSHLSFQEFFAAEYLAERITGPRWFDRPSDAGDAPGDLERYAEDPDWHETLLLLFGLFAGRPEWSRELAGLLFGKDFSKLFADPERLQPTRPRLARLLADISMDPHSGLPQDTREAAWRTCWRWDLGRGKAREPKRPDVRGTKLAPTLLSSTDLREQRQQLGLLRSCSEEVPGGIVDLSGYGASDGWEFLGELRNVKALWLRDTDLRDLRPVGSLSDLRALAIDSTPVTDLGPLSSLTKLEGLVLIDTEVTDLGPLSSLTSLESLHFAGTKVTDLGPLSSLTRLKWLDLSFTRVADLGPLSSLTRLKWLDFSSTRVTDLGPLSSLKSLRQVYLDEERVPDQEVEALKRLRPDIRISKY